MKLEPHVAENALAENKAVRAQFQGRRCTREVDESESKGDSGLAPRFAQGHGFSLSMPGPRTYVAGAKRILVFRFEFPIENATSPDS